MRVVNVHQRLLHATPQQAGALIDQIASPQDVLWPHQSWPRIRFDRPLGVGARGGHGPIRYFVEAYTPAHSIRFRFTEPKGFKGWHACEILDATPVMILLDEFSLQDMHTAGQRTRQESAAIKLGASGSVPLDTIRAIAQTGVDYISVGSITKHIQAVDLSMRIL